MTVSSSAVDRIERACCMCGYGTTTANDGFCSDHCREAAMEYARNILRRNGWNEDEIEHGRSRPVSLYRHFDEHGSLLYVGISLNAIARLSAHHRDSCWFDRIARVEIERHPTREAALTAELEAIHNENPLYNIAGKIMA